MPTSNTYALSRAGEELVALAERALWWPAERILFIADLHAGKLGHFQKHGIALPDTETATDLDRLDRLIAAYRPARLIILGDMFHSDYNDAWGCLVAWRASHIEVSIELVLGNHDRWLSAATISEGGFLVHETPITIGPFVLSHEPLDTTVVATTLSKYNLCGHIHPGTWLSGRGHDRLRLPCFWVRSHQLVLPAFGIFTGLHIIKAHEGDIVLTLTRDVIIPVT